MEECCHVTCGKVALAKKHFSANKHSSYPDMHSKEIVLCSETMLLQLHFGKNGSSGARSYVNHLSKVRSN